MPDRPTESRFANRLLACGLLLSTAAFAVAAFGAPTGRVDACVGSVTETALLACRTRLHEQSSAAQERLLDKLRKRHASICSYQADPVRRPAS